MSPVQAFNTNRSAHKIYKTKHHPIFRSPQLHKAPITLLKIQPTISQNSAHHHTKISFSVTQNLSYHHPKFSSPVLKIKPTITQISSHRSKFFSPSPKILFTITQNSAHLYLKYCKNITQKNASHYSPNFISAPKILLNTVQISDHLSPDIWLAY